MVVCACAEEISRPVFIVTAAMHMRMHIRKQPFSEKKLRSWITKVPGNGGSTVVDFPLLSRFTYLFADSYINCMQPSLSFTTESASYW